MTEVPAGSVAQAVALPWSRSLRTAAAVVVALGGPAAISLLAFGSPHEAVPALLYVLAILVATALGGRLTGLLAAAASFVPFYYFFVAPYHAWAVKGDGALAIGVFGATAILGGEVLARQRGARERAEETAESSLQALETALRLQHGADALISARTPEDVLDAVLSEGVRAAEARGGLIATLSDDGEWLEVVASRGYRPEYIEPFQRFPLAGDFPLSEAVRTGEGVFLRSEQERDRRYPELVGRSQPGHGLACLPLIGLAGPIGGLVFSFESDQEFPPERRALKTALARQVALALERARATEAEDLLRSRLTFVDAATALLTSSLDLEETLARLTSLAVPRLADWCSITVLEEETGSLEQVVVAHQDPERKRWAEEMQTRTRPVHIDDEFDLTAQVVRTGEPVFLREVPQQLLDEASERDPEAAKALEEITIHSVITLPLRTADRALGALSLVTEQRDLTDADFELAQQLSARAAIAIDNARLYREAERRAAAALALAYVGDGVVLLDEDGRVRFWNAAAAAITGLRESDAIGHRAADVLPLWEELTHHAELADAEAPGRARARSVTVPVDTPAGDRWISVAGVAFDEGVVYALRDVTDEQALERARSDFVATASHELRTPLAAVFGAARTLRRTDIDLPEEQRERFLEIIESETERLTAIVSQILLAGQLEEGRVDLATSATDLRPLAQSVLESTRMRTPDDLELTLEENGDSTVALADEDKLRQVLVNLLDNAIKYSPEGGEVTVGLGSAPGLVTLTVRDGGLGIPPAEQERIFEKFYRLDPALTRGVGGSGLGLYISRELVSRMGGRLSVRSRPGEGAAFTVELPAA
ncbi:MAG TPA: ATP-binding protein [Gaiellaceae bacterium]|nr:ATP-binding protein [Gaiellaceae bacterium]